METIEKFYKWFKNSYINLIITAIAFVVSGIKCLFHPETVADIYVQIMGFVIFMEFITTCQQIYIKYLQAKNDRLQKEIDEINSNTTQQ